MGGLIPSSNTGLCMSLSDGPSPLLTNRPSDIGMRPGRLELFCSDSTVNLMLSSTEVRCCVNCSTPLSYSTVNASSVYLNQIDVWRVRCFPDCCFFKLFHVHIGHYWGHR